MSNIISKKLKAIVFTDIVDFTKISASDEEKALKIIYFITLTMSVIANIILFSFPLVIYKLIKVGMCKIIKKFT